MNSLKNNDKQLTTYLRNYHIFIKDDYFPEKQKVSKKSGFILHFSMSSFHPALELNSHFCF